MDVLVRACCVCMHMGERLYVGEYVKAGGSGLLKHSVAATALRGEQKGLNAA